MNQSINQSVGQSINQSINQAMNQSFDFKHFQTDAGGALPANLFPFRIMNHRRATPAATLRRPGQQIQKLNGFQNDRRKSPLPPVFWPRLPTVPVQLGLKFQKRLLKGAKTTQNILGRWHMPSLEVRDKA